MAHRVVRELLVMGFYETLLFGPFKHETGSADHLLGEQGHGYL